MSERPFLRLAVVGHTNTGKTSLLRTLTRDPNFGEVQNEPGTTRHVEGARLLVEDTTAIELFDTPGMEDGIALLDYLDQLAQRGQRLDGPDRIRRFLDSPESKRRFEQEARVLNKLLDCDAGLYVIDVRDPVLGKYKDELTVLASCGQPLLPVLNFTRSPNQRADDWREALARLGLHANVEFDTVAPALDGEAQLYEKLALLLDSHASLLKTLNEDIALQRDIRRTDALRLIAELLIDVAAWHLGSSPDPASVAQATDTLRRQVRKRESRCIKALLKRYKFKTADFPYHELPLEGERWGMDLFHPQALRDMGIHVSKGIAAGAAAGVTIDVFTAGLSLGAAALAGAVIGGLWQSSGQYGKRIMGRLKGSRELSVDDAVLRLLGVRQIALVNALERRGHAAQGPIVLAKGPENIDCAAHKQADDDSTAQEDTGGMNDVAEEPTFGEATLQQGRLPEELREARSQPLWSTLSVDYSPNPRREQVIKSLAKRLE